MKENQVCKVCQTPLSLSRREVHRLAIAVKQAANGRYFVPDPEVHALVHELHSKPRLCSTDR